MGGHDGSRVASDAPALLDLPLDRPRTAQALPGMVSAKVPCTEAVCADAVRRTSVAAAWLRRVTGQDDLVITVGGSGGPQTISLDVSEDPALPELIERVEQALQLDRQVAVERATAAPGGQVMVLGTDDQVDTAGADLILHFGDGSLELSGAASLFDQLTLERFADHVARLASAAITGSRVRVSELPLLGQTERALVIDRWNQTVRPFSDGLCVHELISAQAAATPGRTAIVHGDESVSYAELEERSSRLANYLIRCGAGPGKLVGIHLERSQEMVTTALAVMKSGAGYVPLDPSFPPDRLDYMVEDSGLIVLVTQAALAGTLRLPAGVVEVQVDADREVIASQPSAAPEVAVGCRDAIYVIYTSGSTGLPKGVVLEHRSVVNFLESMAVEPGLSADDVVLAVTTLSFDIAVLELYLPLICGAQVVVASQTATTDPSWLLRTIKRRGVTVIQATPATWRMLIDGGWSPRSTPALRAFCGGEALPPALAAQLTERAAEVWNLYGPTETTVWSTVQQVEPDAPVSIGRPIANTRLYVVDPRLRPAPIGVLGELLIGGDGLARGYHKRPELTAEKFIPDPFLTGPDARAYRTGDLVRWRPDGRIEYVGRVDHQVKVRGFRIELGEIETCLGRHPAVEEAVVLAVEDDRSQKQLVAYVTLAGDAHATRTELRRTVQEKLPHYMVPASVVVLDQMPRTPNGKTDRKALPAPVWDDVEREVAFAKARNKTERRVVALWEETIGVAPIGVNDDLFTLGVDSLTTARLIGRMERRFRTELPIGAVFAASTPARMAELLRGGVPERRWSSLTPITPVHDGSDALPLFCVHGGAGTVLLYAELARRLGPTRPVYGLHAQGLYGHDPVHTSVPQMAAAYVAQIRDVQPHGPYAIVGYCFGGHVAHEMALQLRAVGEDIDLVGYINAPSIEYLREHDPIFDHEGAVTGAGGEWLRPQRTGPARRRWAPSTLLWRTRRKRARLRFEWAVRHERPLPTALRERAWFQRLAQRAERDYAPGRLDAPAIVWRAEGLYFSDDLGWRQHLVDEPLCIEVPGEQPIPRVTMTEPFVAHLAEPILTVRGGNPEPVLVS